MTQIFERPRFNPYRSIHAGQKRLAALIELSMRSFKRGHIIIGALEVATLPLSAVSNLIYRPLMHTLVLAPLDVSYRSLRAGAAYLYHGANKIGFDLEQFIDALKYSGLSEAVLAISETLIDNKVNRKAFRQQLYQAGADSSMIENVEHKNDQTYNNQKLKFYFTHYHDFMFAVVMEQPILRNIISAQRKLIQTKRIALGDLNPVKDAS